MNLSELISSVRFRLDEEFPGLWRDSDIKTALNIADRELYDVYCYINPQHFISKRQVTIPADTVETTWSTLDNNLADLRLIALINDVTNSTRGQPVTLARSFKEMFYDSASIYAVVQLGSDRFRIKPTPSTARTWDVYYVPAPSTMSASSDTPNCPVFTHDYIALKAAVLCLQQKHLPHEPFTAELTALRDAADMRLRGGLYRSQPQVINVIKRGGA